MPKRSRDESPVPKKAKSSAADDLMAISDEEIVDTPPPKERVVTNNLASLSQLKQLREQFYEKFTAQINGEEIDIEAYRNLLNETAEDDPIEQKTLVDQLLRDFIVEKISRDKWNTFLELSIQLAKGQICSASSPIALISDFIEFSSLSQCEEVFEFVESRLPVWKDPFFMNSGKNAVLRMCNDLLRRLSRAQNTIFCGRILLFLANYFPFSERSGLNIMSEFNTENTTGYKKGDGSDDPEDQMEISHECDEKLFEGMELSIPGLEKLVSITQEEKKNKVKVDYNLYVKFWSLQDFFRNPSQCYNKGSWKSFSGYITDVLTAFTSFKIGISNKSLAKISSQSSEIPKLGDDLFFPKYLTNRRLLELQMGDGSFRRNFMLQLLIILQYLTSGVKFKSENQVLDAEQTAFVKSTTERIFNLLKEMQDGESFVKTVQHILKREDTWSKWKNEGCQPFKKPKAESEEVEETTTVKKKRPLGEILEEAAEQNKFLLGNPELTRLWNICGDNLEACRSSSRDFLPNMDNFFVDAFKELDPEPTPPHVLADPSKREIKQKKTLSNPNFGWRALRLLARNSPFFFQLAPSPPVQPMQNYLEYILKKIAAEMEPPEEKMSEEILPVENEEVLKSVEPIEQEVEEGEVGENIRNLTEIEIGQVGKLIGGEWKTLAKKLGFKGDEIDFFETDKGADAGGYMLKMWTEQEKEEATLADLLYILEGLGLRKLVTGIFP